MNVYVEVLMDGSCKGQQAHRWATRPFSQRALLHRGPTWLEDDCACVCCGLELELFKGEVLDEDAVYVCGSCDDRARERIGIDFDYEELGSY